MTERLLELEDVHLDVPHGAERRPILRGVSLAIAPGEVVSLVGESGSGKSVTARAAMGLLPAGAGVTGAIRFAGRSVLGATRRDLREYRARKVAMIFQDPRAHINPVRRIGDHLTEAAVAIAGMRRAEASRRAEGLLAAARIEDPGRTMRSFPHQLSGGMLQRVMIAGALMCGPQLLIADECTTALDVTTQAEVMAILARLRAEYGLALLLITHDLELAAATADRTTVMYAGRIVEEQGSGELHDHPIHPYTAGLIRSRPAIDVATRRLEAIPGRPIAAYEVDGGCAFASRCPRVVRACRAEDPQLLPYGGGRAACLRAGERLTTSRTASDA